MCGNIRCAESNQDAAIFWAASQSKKYVNSCAAGHLWHAYNRQKARIIP